MNTYIKKSQAIIYILATIAILLLVSIWPLRLLNRWSVSASKPDKIVSSAVCNDEHVMAQVFVSDGNRLESVDVYIYNDMSGKEIEFTLYDGTLTGIYSKKITVDSGFKAPGFFHIPIKMDIDRGMAYIASVSGGENDLYVGLESHFETTNASALTIAYDGIEDADHNMVMNYNYAVELMWWQIIIAYSVILLIISAIIHIIRKTFGTRFPDKNIKVQKIFQYTLNPIVIFVTSVLLWMIFPRQTFSHKPINNIFWYIGVLLFSAFLLYEINYKRSDEKPLITMEYIKSNYRGLFTSIAVSGMLWYCFEYMNGLYDIHHEYAARRILIWFLVTLISTYKKDEILRVSNAIWLLVGIPIVYFYAKPYFGVNELETIYTLNAYIIYFGGFVLLNIVLSLFKLISKKKMCLPINWIYAIPFTIFFIGICILSNTRAWPGYMTAIVALLIARLLIWEERTKWYGILCDGIIINFLCMMMFSLLHRPYYGYIYHRYNMAYMTVTMTATHLTLCMMAITVKLYIKSRENDGNRKLLPYLLLFGIIADYSIMTMSRTGYLAIICAIGVATLLTVCKNKSTGKLYEFFSKILILIATTIVVFPITFTFTRILPALNDDPIIYDYEPAIVTIYKGTSPDYEYYMDLPRFIECFGSKVFGIGDATVSVDRILFPDINAEYYGSGIILASAGDDFEEIYEIEHKQEISNGRFDIYRSYLEQTNLWGHEKMGAILDDGSEATHAHNIYLQVIYDHGWVFGIYFMLFMAFTWIYSIIIFRKNKNTPYIMVVPVFMMGFLVAGLVEWIFHPCNPFGLSVILAIAPLIIKVWNDEKSN